MRAAHRKAAFRRAEGDAVPPPKCLGFVQTYDAKPRRRLWELMKLIRNHFRAGVLGLAEFETSRVPP